MALNVWRLVVSSTCLYVEVDFLYGHVPLRHSGQNPTTRVQKEFYIQKQILDEFMLQFNRKLSAAKEAAPAASVIKSEGSGSYETDDDTEVAAGSADPGKVIVRGSKNDGEETEDESADAASGPTTAVAASGPITAAAASGPITAVAASGPITAAAASDPITAVAASDPTTAVAASNPTTAAAASITAADSVNIDGNVKRRKLQIKSETEETKSPAVREISELRAKYVKKMVAPVIRAAVENFDRMVYEALYASMIELVISELVKSAAMGAYAEKQIEAMEKKASEAAEREKKAKEAAEKEAREYAELQKNLELKKQQAEAAAAAAASAAKATAEAEAEAKSRIEDLARLRSVEYVDLTK